MIRAALENALSATRLDKLFENHANRQRNRELLFSSVCDLMGLVALRIHPSPHAAFQAQAEELSVTVKALYDKLQRMEPNLSRQLVRDTAGRMDQVVRRTGGTVKPLLPGYCVKILDGNHFRHTQRRIWELRQVNGAPLPGQALVVLNPETRLAIDVFPCEDGHASERSLLPQVLETVQTGDVWIDDRNFCTAGFLLGIHQRKAFFVTRQHAQTPRCELIGKRVPAGLYETGKVFEQAAQIFHPDGRCLIVRRVTIQLYQPTRDGDQEIHIFTNLPKRTATALRVAQLYRQRWTIETAFADVAKCLEGEIETLGYPRAALFSFCSALVAFNLLSVVLAALRGVHGVDVIQNNVSFYYLADEVAHTHRGLTIAVPDSYWAIYADMTPSDLARALLSIARSINLSRYQKHKRGPIKKIKPMTKTRRQHVSTAKILANAKT
jgi:IS4 transposase